MRNIVGLTLLGLAIAAPVSAQQSLNISYPPAKHTTTSDRIFFIGSAPATGNVLINGKAIARSPAGNFAPSFPLKVGENVFTIRHQDREVKRVVTRTATQRATPTGLSFAPNSLTPAVDIARLPGERVCFGAIAPPNATVSVRLGNQNIPLVNQQDVVELPPNLAALTQNNSPQTVKATGNYIGCASANTAGNLGRPQFQLTLNGQSISQQSGGNVQILSPVQLEIAEVIVDGGIARTGPTTDHSRLTPLPKGTRASVTGREGDWVRLDYGGWISSKEVRIVPNAAPAESIIRSVRARQVAGATEVSFPLQAPVPINIQQGDRTLTLTLYNTTAQTDIIRLDDDPVISRLDWQQLQPGVVEYTFNLKSLQQWGYNVRYEGTTLVLSLRHPPNLTQQSGRPLAGVTILLDPGHGGSESGAVGPTGYPEKSVNLVVSRLLADRLRERGANIIMTRTDDATLSLPDRVAMINKTQPAIALSVHYNSLPDWGDAENTKGFGTFWYHPQAHSLAVFLHNHIVQQLGRPSYGVFWNNLALARPASAPSVLLELGFMSNPVEFEWVTNPQEQQKLAQALAEGIVQWFANTR